MYRILSVFYSEAAEDILLLVIVSKIKIAIITCRRKALYLAGNLDFGTKTEFRCTQVDIRQYEDREQILSEYHVAVRNEIERVKNSHE